MTEEAVAPEEETAEEPIEERSEEPGTEEPPKAEEPEPVKEVSSDYFARYKNMIADMKK